MRIQTVTSEIAESLGLPHAGGALIAFVTPDGPAAAAGIEVSDVVLSFDGQDVTAMRQLPKLVAQTPIDKEVEVVFLRNGERKTTKVKVGRLEEEAKPAADTPEKKDDPVETPRKKSSLGLTFAEMSDELRSRYGIERAVEGVVITEVDPESPVAETEVKPGDVVVEVTHEKVKSPSELNARLDALRKLKRKSALLLVADHQGEMNFVAVSLE